MNIINFVMNAQLNAVSSRVATMSAKMTSTSHLSQLARLGTRLKGSTRHLTDMSTEVSPLLSHAIRCRHTVFHRVALGHLYHLLYHCLCGHHPQITIGVRIGSPPFSTNARAHAVSQTAKNIKPDVQEADAGALAADVHYA